MPVILGQTVAVPWLFLVVSLVGAWFTWNTYHPSSRWQVVALSFFAAWLTGELALWHIAWQAVATALFVAAGALDAWPGWLGLAITLVSWVGLVRLNSLSRGSADVIDTTLREGLGLPEDHPIRDASRSRGSSSRSTCATAESRG